MGKIVPFGFLNVQGPPPPPAENGYIGGNTSTSKVADRLDFNTQTVTGVNTPYYMFGRGGAGHNADHAFTWVNSNVLNMGTNPTIVASRLTFATFTMATAGGSASYFTSFIPDFGVTNGSTWCNFAGLPSFSTGGGSVFRFLGYDFTNNTVNFGGVWSLSYVGSNYRGGRMMYPSDGTAYGIFGWVRSWTSRSQAYSNYHRFDHSGANGAGTPNGVTVNYTLPQNPLGDFRRCGNTPTKSYNQSQNNASKFNNVGVEFTFSTETVLSTSISFGQPYGDTGAVYNDIYMYGMRGQAAGGAGTEVWRFTFNTTTAAINLGNLCTSSVPSHTTFMDLDGSIL